MQKEGRKEGAKEGRVYIVSRYNTSLCPSKQPAVGGDPLQLLQGETYQRVYQAEPAPAHLITPLHQAHLASLAEESEEGSDQVSESDGGLIHDDDLAAEPMPAVPTHQVSTPTSHFSYTLWQKLSCLIMLLALLKRRLNGPSVLHM